MSTETVAKIRKLQEERQHYSKMAMEAHAGGRYESAADAQVCAWVVHREIAWHMGIEF
jgi:hypothetical protein